MFNPPVVWILTAAEIAFGSWIVSLGYPVTGGVIMGMAAGSFISRASMATRVAQLLRKTKD